MADVLFYHLLRSPVEQALRDLLSKCQERAMRVLVLGTQSDALSQIDQKLWAMDNGFMPHGIAGSDVDHHQPILLSTILDNRNDASVLMLVDGARINAEQSADFDRVCLIFDGADDIAVDQARQDWKIFSDSGMSLQYWSQESGAWQLKSKKN